MNCRNICEKYKAIKPAVGGRYAAGQKRCQTCVIFINWKGNEKDPLGIFCPCCGFKLRTTPHNSLYKAKLRASKEANS